MLELLDIYKRWAPNFAFRKLELNMIFIFERIAIQVFYKHFRDVGGLRPYLFLGGWSRLWGKPCQYLTHILSKSNQHFHNLNLSITWKFRPYPLHVKIAHIRIVNYFIFELFPNWNNCIKIPSGKVSLIKHQTWELLEAMETLWKHWNQTGKIWTQGHVSFIALIIKKDPHLIHFSTPFYWLLFNYCPQRP